jgi:hypothetical protein
MERGQGLPARKEPREAPHMEFINNIFDGIDTIRELAIFLFAYLTNLLPDNVRFIIFPTLRLVAHYFGVHIFEDGSFRIFEDGSVW